MLLYIIPSFWGVVSASRRTKIRLRFPVRCLRPTCPRCFSQHSGDKINGSQTTSLTLVTKSVLPIWIPSLVPAGSRLLVSEFFWGPFHNHHLPWPFLVILMMDCFIALYRLSQSKPACEFRCWFHILPLRVGCLFLSVEPFDSPTPFPVQIGVSSSLVLHGRGSSPRLETDNTTYRGRPAFIPVE